MSRFWEHYARVNDDVRAELIDRAWFGRHMKETPMQDDIARIEGQETTARQEAVVDSHDPFKPQAMDGIGRSTQEEVNPESTRAAVEDYYGMQPGPSGAEMGAAFEEERAYADQQAGVEASRVQHFEEVYGQGVTASEQSELYGHGGPDPAGIYGEAPREANMSDLYGSGPEGDPGSLYGQDMQQANTGDVYGYDPQPQGYGYDALDQPEQDIQPPEMDMER